MTQHDAAFLLFASMIYVFLKALQQLNVVGGHYRWIWPISFGMALCEVTIIVRVATMKTLIAALPIGLGAGAGAMLAMWLHKRYVAL